jgi:hypothetical protein
VGAAPREAGNQAIGCVVGELMLARHLPPEEAEPVFAEDGDALARYLDARLTAGGIDIGGPRYSEQHSGFEACSTCRTPHTGTAPRPRTRYGTNCAWARSRRRPSPWPPTRAATATPTIHAEAFTALIGNPAGDARGAPALGLRRR